MVYHNMIPKRAYYDSRKGAGSSGSTLGPCLGRPPAVWAPHSGILYLSETTPTCSFLDSLLA